MIRPAQEEKFLRLPVAILKLLTYIFVYKAKSSITKQAPVVNSTDLTAVAPALT
jgi:hypothetical protein